MIPRNYWRMYAGDNPSVKITMDTDVDPTNVADGLLTIESIGTVDLVSDTENGLLVLIGNMSGSLTEDKSGVYAWTVGATILGSSLVVADGAIRIEKALVTT